VGRQEGRQAVDFRADKDRGLAKFHLLTPFCGAGCNQRLCLADRLTYVHLAQLAVVPLTPGE
jgi:hypothetical protein